MISAVKEVFLERDGWQAMLDHHHQVFSSLQPGAGIGILPKTEFDSPEGEMLAWEAASGRLTAEYRTFKGFQEAGVDLLFVVDDEALEEILNKAKEDPFAKMKQLIRNGNIVFYSMRAQNELLDLGFEDLIDVLGLPFQGACR